MVKGFPSLFQIENIWESLVEGHQMEIFELDLFIYLFEK